MHRSQSSVSQGFPFSTQQDMPFVAALRRKHHCRDTVAINTVPLSRLRVSKKPSWHLSDRCFVLTEALATWDQLIDSKSFGVSNGLLFFMKAQPSSWGPQSLWLFPNSSRPSSP